MPPELAHLWDAETGCWKEGSLLAMLEILAPNRPRSERVETAGPERTPRRGRLKWCRNATEHGSK